MRIKKKNLTKLASLSALGAGALGVAAGTAQADVITYIPGSPIVMGYGGHTSYQINLGGNGYFNVGAILSIGEVQKGWLVGAGGSGSGVLFAKTGSVGPFLAIQTAPPPGMSWTSPYKSSGGVIALGGAHSITGQTSSPAAFRRALAVNPGTPVGSLSYFVVPGAYPSRYALFQFQDSNNNTQYGWLEVSVSAIQPNVTLDAWAYTEGSSAPEPSTMSMTGLAALALGALGLRRWRASRKTAA